MVWEAFHHSWQEYYRYPYGAVPTGSAVRLRLCLLTDDIPQCYLRLWNHDTVPPTELVMECIAQTTENGRQRWLYEYTIAVPSDPLVLWYDFIIRCGDRVCYYECLESGGEGRLWEEQPVGRFQITVYHPQPIPDWFKNALVYQIFPDRFYKSLPAGQFRATEQRRLYHADWNDLPFYNRNEDGSIRRWDFFGGDLVGIIEKLPYLESLGVEAIYLNPIFQATSNHRYDTGDYHRIDPLLGTEEDLRCLCAEAERDYGIRIILDGVFAHCGADSVYFNLQGDYPAIGATQSLDSPYYPWFFFESWPNRYRCWWGIKALPWIDCDQSSYRDFIYRQDNSVLRHWMDCGVKGWRLDVADELSDEFINEFKSALRIADAEAVLIGEVWEDASHKMSYGELRRYFSGYELDGVTNYPLREAWLNFLLNHSNAESAWRTMMQLHANYPPENFQACLNLIGSHDRARIITLLGGAPAETELSAEERENYRLSPVAEAQAVQHLRLLLILQLLSPGAASIYYGDEKAVQGYSDPYNRSSFPWDFNHEEVRICYHRLIGLRKQYRELLGGRYLPFYHGEDILGFRLRQDTEELLVIVNRGDYSQEIKCGLNPPAASVAMLEERHETEPGSLAFERLPLRLVDLLDQPAVTLQRECPEHFYTLHLPPHSGKTFYVRYAEKREADNSWESSFRNIETGLPTLQSRCAGILLHISCLPSAWGIGTMGPEAYDFLDFLQASGQRVWQILPLNVCGDGNSPYQSISLMAGNPWLISPEGLVAEGWLNQEEFKRRQDATASLAEQPKVDYQRVKDATDAMMQSAYARFTALSDRQTAESYQEFCRQQGSWLNDYALYLALSEYYGDHCWQNWPRVIKWRDSVAIEIWRRKLERRIDFHCFVQFVFYRQWERLKTYAYQRGIAILGDIPIYPAASSCDTWVNPQLYWLDQEGWPRWLAGVPPDYFSMTGQLWENPLYNWKNIEAEDYRWWIDRVEHGIHMFDYLRLDHFRALEAGWAVMAGQNNASSGEWRRGPGYKLLRALEQAIGTLPCIAENLGFITRDVESLRECFGLPGMQILQFSALDEQDRPIKTSADADSVYYSGTHDNETLLGWLRHRRDGRPPLTLEAARVEGMELLEKLLAVESPWVILPLQDVLLLDNDARMNVPGTVVGNWEWRAPVSYPEYRDRLRSLTTSSGRI